MAENSANTVPFMMPYIDAFFMPRAIGDRPDVVPERRCQLRVPRPVCRDAARHHLHHRVFHAHRYGGGLHPAERRPRRARGLGQRYDIRCLLDATVKLRDGRKLTDMEMPLVGKLALKEALRKIEGTEVEKLLKEYNVI